MAQKKTAAKKPAARKASKTTRKPAAKKAAPKKTAARKTAAKKTAPRKKVAAKKTASAARVVSGNTSSPAFAKKYAGGAQAFNPFLLSAPPSNLAMEKMMTQGKSQFDKLAKDANDAGREGFEAFIKSGTIFARGLEDIIRTSMALAQDSAEKQTQFLKEAMSSKTLNEWTEAQNKIAQANFDDFMAGATKISELSVKVLSEASEPINEQLSKGIKKATESLAA